MLNNLVHPGSIRNTGFQLQVNVINFASEIGFILITVGHPTLFALKELDCKIPFTIQNRLTGHNCTVIRAAAKYSFFVTVMAIM